jgi:tetratricopeptide (TPR) repeat protein
MKQNKENSKTIKTINVIILILFVLFLCSTIYYVNIEKANASNKLTTKTALASTPPDSALIRLQAAIDLAKVTPNETNYIDLSLKYFINGKYKECIDASNKALTFNANCYFAYNNMCCAYNKLGWWDEAIAAGKKAIAIRPGDQLATNNLKVSTDGKAEQDKFLKDQEGLLTIHKNEANYIALGNTYYGARRFEKAISAFQKAIMYNSKSTTAYNNICSAYNELGKWKEASENCEKALMIDSTFVLAKNNLKEAKNNLNKK